MQYVGADEWSSVKVEVATNWPDISWAAVVDPCSVVDEAKGKSRTRRAWRMVDERQRRGVGYAAKGWADAETDGGCLAIECGTSELPNLWRAWALYISSA